MPRPAIRRVDADRAVGEILYDVRSGAQQPIRVGEHDKGARVTGLRFDDHFVDRCSCGGIFAKFLCRDHERVRCCTAGNGLQRRAELSELPRGAILVHKRCKLVSQLHLSR